VIGAYNAARWIRRTLESVLAQTHPVLEVLLIDDGSTDATAEIARSFGRVVRYFHQEHRGRPRRNQGIVAARGDYIAFVDADDYWHPSKIETQMKLLLSRDLAWVVCEYEWFDSDSGRTSGPPNSPMPEGDVLESLFLHNFIASATPLVARSVFKMVGTFDESPGTRAVEDWDLWLRIAARFPLGCVQEKLAALRLHAGSLLVSQSLTERVSNLEGVVKRAVDREPARLRPLRPRALANISYAAGVQSIRSGQLREARSYFVRVLHNRPGYPPALGYLLVGLLGAGAAARVTALKRRLWSRN
jgi:hypothetical protein